MSPLVLIALFGWIPFSLVVFTVLPLRRALLVSFLGGWLLLPTASYPMAGLPNYTRFMAVSLSAVLGLALYGSHHLAGLRLGLLDLPMLLWCLVPAASSLANGNGAYDAAAVTLGRGIDWAIPYLVGRALFRDFATMDQLVRALFVGGLVYAPLCLWEIRMSPQLHATLYGFAQHSFLQHIRLDGYRPMVFMEHGLMVGMWMSIATLSGFTLWRHGSLRQLARWPVGPLLLGLFLTTILCKAMGPLALLGAGLAALAAVRWLRSKWPLYLMVAGAAAFLAARVLFGWQAEGLLALVRSFAPERASSMWYRIESEQGYLPGIWQRPLLGWSSWGFAPPPVEDGELAIQARDSLWLITAMSFGLVGLVLSLAIYLVPVLALLRRLPVRALLDRRAAGACAAAAALCLCVWDNVFNAMINPVYTLVLGGVAGLAAGLPARGAPVPPRRPARPRCARRTPRVLVAARAPATGSP